MTEAWLSTATCALPVRINHACCVRKSRRWPWLTCCHPLGDAAGCADVYACGDACHLDRPDNVDWFQMRLWSQARTMGLYTAQCMADALDDLDGGFAFEVGPSIWLHRRVRPPRVDQHSLVALVWGCCSDSCLHTPRICSGSRFVLRCPRLCGRLGCCVPF